MLNFSMFIHNVLVSVVKISFLGLELTNFTMICLLRPCVGLPTRWHLSISDGEISLLTFYRTSMVICSMFSSRAFGIPLILIEFLLLYCSSSSVFLCSSSLVFFSSSFSDDISFLIGSITSFNTLDTHRLQL